MARLATRGSSPGAAAAAAAVTDWSFTRRRVSPLTLIVPEPWTDECSAAGFLRPRPAPVSRAWSAVSLSDGAKYCPSASEAERRLCGCPGGGGTNQSVQRPRGQKASPGARERHSGTSSLCGNGGQDVKRKRHAFVHCSRSCTRFVCRKCVYFRR